MKTKTLFYFLAFLCFVSSIIVQAQPANNECSGALDVSQLFSDAAASACAVQVSGTFNNSTATSEPSDLAFTGFTGGEVDTGGFCCTCEQENGTGAPSELNNTLWFVFTPPANGNYFIEAIAQSSANGCGGTLGTFEDTQILLYTAADGTCNTLAFSGCSEDGPSSSFSVFPAGGTFNLIGGLTYYMIVDEYWDGGVETGDFCLEVTYDNGVCANCGDGLCDTGAAGESLCNCPVDCPCNVTLSFLDWNTFGVVPNPIGYCAEDLTNPAFPFDGGPNPSPEVLYIPVVLDADSEQCLVNPNDVFGNGVLSAGDIFNSTSPPIPNLTGDIDRFIFFIVVDAADVTSGNTTFTFNGNQGLGCAANINIDLTGIGDPLQCTPSCVSGSADPALNGQQVCRNGVINLCTDGTEDLSLPCASDDGSPFQYGWIVYSDSDGDGVFETQWTFINTIDADGDGFGDACLTAIADGLFQDQLGGTGPLPAGTYEICGVAGCFNSDGTGVQVCQSNNCLLVDLLDGTDPACVCAFDPLTATSIICDNNGSPADPTDDTYTFSVTVTGTNGFSWSDDQGNTGQTYGSIMNYGPFPISGGNVTVTFTDDNDPACTTQVQVSAPATCSNPACQAQAGTWCPGN